LHTLTDHSQDDLQLFLSEEHMMFRVPEDGSDANTQTMPVHDSKNVK